MELVAQTLEVRPWRPEAYERSRAVLRAVIAQSATTESADTAGTGPASVLASVTEVSSMRKRGSSKVSNRMGTKGKIGIGAGVGAVAAAAALVLAVTATPPAAPAGGGSGGSAAPASSTQSPLLSLASYLTTANATQSGDASLVIRAQAIGKRAPEVSYNLYTDTGAFYGGGDKKSLMKAVAQHEDLSAGIQAREVKAALAAVKGDLTTTGRQMVNASPNSLGLGLSAADRQAIWDKAKAQYGQVYKDKGIPFAAHPPTGKALRLKAGNAIWNNSVDALSAGAANPKVRAGVLRLLSTVPEVTVKKSTEGQGTLILTAGSALFGGGSPEVLTIDAKTGMPIKSVFKASGDLSASVSTFKVSRVSLDNVKSGKF
jgi:hypothetical protein